MNIGRGMMMSKFFGVLRTSPLICYSIKFAKTGLAKFICRNAVFAKNGSVENVCIKAFVEIAEVVTNTLPNTQQENQKSPIVRMGPVCRLPNSIKPHPSRLSLWEIIRENLRIFFDSNSHYGAEAPLEIKIQTTV
jgi:hypothetical protein